MFEAIQRIGKGSSCQVYTVISKIDNKLYAIKNAFLINAYFFIIITP